ncbi:unnamed protein product [Phytomonas sp. Hart1]|nr:unnamed protein product [Phytomonas sp. Hart1]|eukprot:CCW70225.1 unnamed protein product [Phytomonas sp. isolate Hart1]
MSGLTKHFRSSSLSCTVRRSLTSTQHFLKHQQENHPISSSLVSTAKRFLVIETSETPNPECLRFFSMYLSFLKPGFSIDLPSKDHEAKSPLAAELFQIDGVDAIFISDEYITVRKSPEKEWETLIPRIQDGIRRFADSGAETLSSEGQESLAGYNDDTEPSDDDDEVVLAVKELLATRIRPMLRADGGNVRYIDMDDGTVYLLLEGACKACPSSHLTLKGGIERMLMHWIPEVVETQEVSDEVAEDILAEKRLRKKLKETNQLVNAH